MTINLLVFACVIWWARSDDSILDVYDISFGERSEERIVGGYELFDTMHTPQVVAMQFRNKTTKEWELVCGGSILSALFVITACHCVSTEGAKPNEVILKTWAVPLNRWRFVAGTSHLQNMDGPHQIRNPEYVRYHPWCRLERNGRQDLSKDVAVAKMTQPFRFNEFVMPVKMISFRRDQFEIILEYVMRLPEPYCVVAGWGRTQGISLPEFFNLTPTAPPNDTSTRRTPITKITTTTESTNQTEDADRLKYVELLPMFEGECMVNFLKAFREHFSELTVEFATRGLGLKLHDEICTTSFTPNEGPCQGDSGSGLLCEGGYFLGIVSWGPGCANKVPDVYQGIPVVLDWIRGEVCTIQNCDEMQYIPEKCNRTDLQDSKILDLYEKCSGNTTASVEPRTSPITLPSYSGPTEPNKNCQPAALRIGPQWYMILMYLSIKNFMVR